MNPLDVLGEADPVVHVGDEAGVDAPPPSDLLARIVSAPVPTRRRAPRRRLAVAVAVAVAVGATVVVALPSGHHLDLAARAYAATAPDPTDVFFTEETSVNDFTSVAGGEAPPTTTTHIQTWQRGNRMHDVMDVVEDGKRYRYEHDDDGTVFRTLYRGKVDTSRVADAHGELDSELETVVERFRDEYAHARLRDAGETTFDGRRAHAYQVVGRDQTFYIDPETALPLGYVWTFPLYPPKVDPRTHRLVEPKPGDKPSSMSRITETVNRFERLPGTPENVAKLDAPNIDAAARR